VSPDDRELGDALEYLLDDEALRLRMGKAARKRVLADFDARNTTAQLVDLVSEAYERSPAHAALWIHP
jgi:glycosyltransferase involved in cell wall biosynthesis